MGLGSAQHKGALISGGVSGQYHQFKQYQQVGYIKSSPDHLSHGSMIQGERGLLQQEGPRLLAAFELLRYEIL